MAKKGRPIRPVNVSDAPDMPNGTVIKDSDGNVLFTSEIGLSSEQLADPDIQEAINRTVRLGDPELVEELLQHLVRKEPSTFETEGIYLPEDRYPYPTLTPEEVLAKAPFRIHGFGGSLSSADRRVVRGIPCEKWPWTLLTKSALRALTKTDPETARERMRVRVRNLIPSLLGGVGWAPSAVNQGLLVDQSGRLALETARWFQSEGQSLVEVTLDSQQVLEKLGGERYIKGLSSARWRELPRPGHPMYGQTIVFYIAGDDPVVAFVTPFGLVASEYILYTEFRLDFADYRSRKADGLWKKDSVVPWYQPSRGDEPEEMLFPERITARWLDREEHSLAEWLRGKDRGLSQALPHRLGGLVVVVNAIAAMAAEYDVVIEQGREGRKRRRKRRSRTLAGKHVHRVNLDATGLLTWAYRPVVMSEATGPALGELGALPPSGSRKTPKYHKFTETKAIVWVRQPEAGETVLAHRENQSGTVVYAVRRKRKGGHRGEGHEPTLSILELEQAS